MTLPSQSNICRKDLGEKQIPKNRTEDVTLKNCLVAFPVGVRQIVRNLRINQISTSQMVAFLPHFLAESEESSQCNAIHGCGVIKSLFCFLSDSATQNPTSPCLIVLAHTCKRTVLYRNPPGGSNSPVSIEQRQQINLCSLKDCLTKWATV